MSSLIWYGARDIDVFMTKEPHKISTMAEICARAATIYRLIFSANLMPLSAVYNSN